MTKVPTEKRYEKEIENDLTSFIDDGLRFNSKTHLKKDTWYNKNQCLIPEEFMIFLKESQPETFNKLSERYGDRVQDKVMSRLNEQIESKGLITVLRKGFSDVFSGKIDTIYFQPNNSLSDKYREEKYLKNRFLLVRQLHYSPNNNNSIDVVIFINGIPILTIELKNQLTGQTIKDSDHQYRFDRNPKGEPLLRFRRCICHFSVDNDLVNMTTELKGESTYFLPYNKTLENIETYSDGFKVDYLWKNILTPTSLLDIIENFVLSTFMVESEWSDKEEKVVKTKKPILIFPRYHQLDVIRKLRGEIKKDGVGQNYLIQHTTGSGKSYEIGWLSFMLTTLFTNNDKDRLFDSIIVITDRTVLDDQLQNTLSELEKEKVKGIVKNIEKNSEQLRKSLSEGKNIIVTTIQKFSVVVNTIKDLKGKNFGVIIDEVHSSQGGKGSKNLQKTLSLNLDKDIEIDNEINEEIKTLKSEMKSHQKQHHISFFGFTGTPKPETIEIFGTKQTDGSKKPFHTYTMRQSIGEEFTMDILKSFTPVKQYFKLISKGDDIELPESRSKKELVKWVNSNSETIRKKVLIIVDNLLKTTVKSINGKGKGMVVVRSISDTIDFFLEINKELKNRGYEDKIKCLIGFSGKTKYKGENVTEKYFNTLSGFKGKDIPEGFKNPLYRLLIVCDKFQTGFDEPHLHSMFVDKTLYGVQCVQTLSRLNRKTLGKTNTFILDFVNDIETIKESFQDFYQTTILSEETDPNSIYNLLDQIDDYGLVKDNEVNEWSEIYVSKNRVDSQLQPILNEVINRWRSLSDEDRELSKSQIRKYCKLFGYLSMIYEFNNLELYRNYIFFEYLKKKFPIESIQKIDVSDMVDLESLSLEVKDQMNISLDKSDTVMDPKKIGTTIIKKDEEFDMLSEIINDINELYGQILDGNEDNTKKLIQDIVNDEEFKIVINSNNTESNKRIKLEKIYKDKNIKTLDISTQLFEIFDKKEIRDRVISKIVSRSNI